VLVPEKESENVKEREKPNLGVTVREREEGSLPARGKGVVSRDW
jgi:hypothetical protein